MFTGITAGSVYAQLNDLEDLVEDFCELSSVQQSDFFSDYPDMDEFKDEFSRICDIEELRERASDLTDEEKQELRAEFIETAKDIHLAWISPHVQMNAGIDIAVIECREGFSLVMKASNGVPMCLKADTALTMIERGIAVPPN